MKYKHLNIDIKMESFIDEFVSKKERLDVVWLSCFPWASFSSLVSPHDKSITIPELIWDKYLLKNGRYTCNLMIMVHYGFADGYDVGKLIEKINYYIDDFK